MPDRPLLSALREVDDLHRRRAHWLSTSQSTFSAADAALEVARSKDRVRRGVMLGFVCGAGLTIAALALRGAPPSAVEAPAAPQIEFSGRSFVVVDCAWERRSGKLALATGCRLRAPDLVLEVESATSLQARGRNLRVDHGRVRFEVRPRRPGEAAFRVSTPLAEAEVVGTRFVVEHEHDRSSVRVEEGHVRWRRNDGSSVELGANERAIAEPAELVELVAPSPVQAAAEAPPRRRVEPEPGPRRETPSVPPADATAPVPSGVDVERVSASVRRLVLAGRSRAAIQELDTALAALDVGARARQVLSFERGRILQYELADVDAACSHWAAHQAAFPGGLYAVQIDSAKRQAGCQ